MSATADRAQLPGLHLPVTCMADVAVCQSKVRAFAAALGFNLRAQWELAIAVSEAATNMLKYAGTGTMTIRSVTSEVVGLAFEAVDQGRGMGDVQAAERDGISEGRWVSVLGDAPDRNGLGLGLGAIRRMVDSLTIESTPRGTRLCGTRWLQPNPASSGVHKVGTRT